MITMMLRLVMTMIDDGPVFEGSDEEPDDESNGQGDADDNDDDFKDAHELTPEQ